VRQTERDQGLSTADQLRVKALEREVRELLKANEILKLASASLAQAAASTAASSRERVHRPVP